MTVLKPRGGVMGTDEWCLCQLAVETSCASWLHTRFASPRPTTPFSSIDLLLPSGAAASDELPEASRSKSLAEASDSSEGLREHSKLASVPAAAQEPIRLKGLRPKTLREAIMSSSILSHLDERVVPILCKKVALLPLKK